MKPYRIPDPADGTDVIAAAVVGILAGLAIVALFGGFKFLPLLLPH